MKKIIYLFAFATIVLFSSCEENIETSDLNFINFGNSEYATRVNEGSTKDVVIPVYTSNVTSADRSFKLVIDANKTTGASSSYVLPESVTIPAGSNKGEIVVNLKDSNLGIGFNYLAFDFEATEGLLIGGSTIIEYIQQCSTEVTLTVDLVFHDSWPEEAGWEVQDSLGGVLASGSVGSYAGQTSATESFTVCAGRDFTFVMLDDYGDGGHTFEVKLGSTVLASIADPYSYGSSTSVAFDTK